jgi:hypothetical protein
VSYLDDDLVEMSPPERARVLLTRRRVLVATELQRRVSAARRTLETVLTDYDQLDLAPEAAGLDEFSFAERTHLTRAVEALGAAAARLESYRKNADV